MNPSRQSPVRDAALTAAVLTLLAAVFLVPFRAASAWTGGTYPSIGALRDSLTAAFVTFWAGGDKSLGPDLTDVVDFWAKFHIVKALLAVALLAASVLLGRRLWVGYVQASSWPRRLGLAFAGIVDATVALLALVIAVANVQGAIAPLSSVLGVMPVGTPGPGLAGTVHDVRHDLASGSTTAPLNRLVEDFAGYHVAMVVLGALVTGGLLAAVVLAWRRRRGLPRAERRERRLLALSAVALLGLAAFFGLITAANASTVASPAPALLGFFEGGA
ncbi:MAG: hypothetical protein U0R64_02095 [Candidatus Nanopelagicales bacterium]